MWLLDQSTRQALEKAYSSGAVPTAEQQIAFEARNGTESGSDPRILTIAGDVAEIGISGVLTQNPDFMSMFFGGGNTTYRDITASLAIAEADESVKRIVLAVDSPGGMVNGLFDAVAAINGATKPIEGVILGQASSAAYALIAQADTIVASNKASAAGSIGVVARIGIDEESVTIASTNAPNKAPDVTTERGKEIVRENLDAYETLFIDAVAEGRSTTPEKVKADFGQGGVLLAEEAMKRGMIDSIKGAVVKTPVVASKTNTADAGGAKLEAKGMTKKELMAQHPELYSAVMEEGVTCERDRVGAHLTMGESSGDTTTAFAAIRDGSEMTASLQAAYMSAGMNQAAVAARAGDNIDELETPNPKEADATAGKNIMALAAELCGVEA